MQRVGAALRRANVRGIVLIHGSFVGTDALGLIRKVSRIAPRAADWLRRLQKQMADSLARDAGNFTDEYAIRLQQSINESGQPPIPVKLHHWSGENLHIARADAAIRLFNELSDAENSRDDSRLLLCGHSHGGNVCALLTNLLGAPADLRERFFQAARSYYRWPLSTTVDMPHWQHAYNQFAEDSPVLRDRLDIVTFGAPIRYGWDTNQCDRLLHFVNHRIVDASKPEYLGELPHSLEHVLEAASGDYIQLLGIAGTDFSPTWIGWRAFLAESRMRRLLQPGFHRRDVLGRLRIGMRVQEDGHTLLVDYGPPEGHVGSHLAGHAVYTSKSLMLFHAEQIVTRLYEAEL